LSAGSIGFLPAFFMENTWNCVLCSRHRGFPCDCIASNTIRWHRLPNAGRGRAPGASAPGSTCAASLPAIAPHSSAAIRTPSATILLLSRPPGRTEMDDPAF
jgi:hypothetical protein